MMTFLKIVSIVGKYGSRAVQWCWDHKSLILGWINAGQAVDFIVQKVKEAVGAR